MLGDGKEISSFKALLIYIELFFIIYFQRVYNMEKIDNDNNEFDEDEYIKELQLRISMLQSERKQTEKEAEIIDNRINVLKIEENKALKGIEVKSKKNQINKK